MNLQEERADFEKRYDAFISANRAFYDELKALEAECRDIRDRVLNIEAEKAIRERKEEENGTLHR